jgi:hypothetical protein
MSKEPGQLAYEAWASGRYETPPPWDTQLPITQSRWARVEAIIRDDEREKVIEECAKIVEAEGIEVAPDNDADRAYDEAIEHAAAAIRAAKEPE